MATTFPPSPIFNQIVTQNNKIFRFDGIGWVDINANTSSGINVMLVPTGDYSSTNTQSFADEISAKIPLLATRRVLVSTAWNQSATTFTLLPFKVYDFGTTNTIITAVTMSLGSVISTEFPEYKFRFKLGVGGSIAYTGCVLAFGNPSLVVGETYIVTIEFNVVTIRKIA